MGEDTRKISRATLALVGLAGVAGWWLYNEKRKQDREKEAFLALAEEVEMTDFDLMSFITKGAGLFGDLKVVGVKALKKSGSVEDALGELHKYTGGKAWLVDATVHGDPVLLLVRRNGSVELLED